MNDCVAVGLPPVVALTEALPADRPPGTVTVRLVAEPNVTLAAVPPKLTVLALVKPVPVRVTTWPGSSVAGLTLVSVDAGGAVTVKATPLLVPPGVLIVTLPVVAPMGTVVVAVVEFVTLKVPAVVPLKLTPVAPVKPVPVSVTLVPTGPLVGLRLTRVRTGAWLRRTLTVLA